MTQDAAVPQEQVLPENIPAWKLLAILGGGGAFAGALIVTAYQWSQPTIIENKRVRLEAAVLEVLKSPDRCESLWFVDGALTPTLPPGADANRTDRVFVGWHKDGTKAGYAIVADDIGFADTVRLIFGVDPEARAVLAFKVLESKETPGLGDGIEKNESFIGGFTGKEAPLVGVKKGASRGNPSHEVDTITGATISSKTVIRIINGAVERWAPRIRAQREEVPR